MQRFWQPLQNVAGLVDLTAGSLRHDEIVNERLDGRGVLRCALDEAERMFVAHRVNTDRCDEDQISSM